MRLYTDPMWFSCVLSGDAPGGRRQPPAPARARRPRVEWPEASSTPPWRSSRGRTTGALAPREPLASDARDRGTGRPLALPPQRMAARRSGLRTRRSIGVPAILAARTPRAAAAGPRRALTRERAACERAARSWRRRGGYGQQAQTKRSSRATAPRFRIPSPSRSLSWTQTVSRPCVSEGSEPVWMLSCV